MNIIGQDLLRSAIRTRTDKFPRFSIIVGEAGSGKKLLCGYIAEQIGAQFTFVETAVDDIRQMIQTANHNDLPTLYVIPDVDRMSNAAKNALLKVTEEVPNNAYIVMTVEDEMTIPPTLRSRASTMRMAPYSEDEIAEYYRLKYAYSAYELEYVSEVCGQPGEVDKLEGIVSEFNDYVNLVIDNIADASDSNVFKMANKIKLKEADVTNAHKYDLKLFWRAFNHEMIKRALLIEDSGVRCNYYRCVACTREYIKDLKVTGINKQMAFDEWIVEIRRILWS